MEVLQQRIDGTLRTANESFGGWQEYKGGRISSDSAETRAPGATYPKQIPGPKTIERITLTRDYDETRDGPAYDRLEALAGGETLFIIGKVIRDGAGNPTSVKTRVGILLEVMGPEGDTDGGTNKSKLEVVLGING